MPHRSNVLAGAKKTSYESTAKSISGYDDEIHTKKSIEDAEQGKTRLGACVESTAA